VSLIVRTMSKLNNLLYRASGGRVAASMRGAPIMLLTTTGHRSGKRRTAPVLYLRDGNDLVIVASYGGNPQHPSWFRNLVAHPDAEVEIGRERSLVRARVADPAERERLWPKAVAMYPPYAEYQTKTTREIPVVILSPAAPARSPSA